MTYKEAYLQCENKEQLKSMIFADINHARIFNFDRLPVIEKAINDVIKERPELDFTDNGKWEL